MNSAFCVEDNQGHVHVCKPLVQKKCSYRHLVDFCIELVWKSTPKYRECRKGYRVVPSVVAYEFSHGSPHICQPMTCLGSRMSRKDWHKCASELIYSLW